MMSMRTNISMCFAATIVRAAVKERCGINSNKNMLYDPKKLLLGSHC